MTRKCGTLAGYSRHRWLKEPTCDACKAAKRDYQREKLDTTPRCRIESCSNPRVSGELCGSHRDREKRNGHPEIYARDPARNFWARVRMGPIPIYAPELGNCWLWTGSKHKAGYGVFKSGRQYVHRYAYEQMVSPIPKGLTIDHLCRVTNCVNPYHFDPVPLAENSRREMAARKELANV